MTWQQINGLRKATQQLTVYGGPNNNNANIGSIFNQEVVSIYGVERGYAYIEYSTTNGAKRGYVLESGLTGATPPTLPNIPTYTNFTSGSYGVSGLGQTLKYYKIGNGPNVAFAVFAQHGWEDAWAYDGIELVNIANRMMSSLSSTGISSNWTLYVIPYANPDGITNGYTNNGPGRCTVSTSIDMNRCWPTNFTPYYTSRNYTGNGPLGAPEAVALRAFIQNNMGSNEKIILDIHGWLNQTYGSAEIGQYFGDQFGFGHSSTYGSGYLETWGKSIGAKSCLVELPMPSSSSDIINRDFSGKLTNAIRNMLNGTSQGSGTEVYEQVRVTASGSLNVRSGPGTSYSIISTLSEGTIVTRIISGVANANGLIWDKIRFNNGQEGYVATNYLQKIDEGNILTEENIKIVKAYCRFNGINGYVGEINGTYDNNIYLTIKEFQRINELSQTGYVNSSTWNAMELNNTSTYNYYKSIMEDYLKYGDAYGPLSVEFDSQVEDLVNTNNKFVRTKNISKLTPSAQETMNTVPQQYGRMQPMERVEKAEQMASDIEKLKSISGWASVIAPLKNINLSLDRFLDNTGNSLWYDNAKTIFDMDAHKEAKDKLLEAAVRSSEKLLPSRNCYGSNFAMDYEESRYIGNVTLSWDLLAEDSLNRLNWYATLRNYRISIGGTVKKVGNEYNLDINYTIKDYYDFNKNSTEEFGYGPYIVQASHLYDLHYSGDAQFFTQYGVIPYNLTWQKGQSFSSIKNR